MAILISQPADIPSHELDQLGPVKVPLSWPAAALIGRKYIDEIPGIDSMGIWECSPGRWQRTIMQEEFAHFLKGSARFIPTDFFAAVAGGADCYLLKFIIHDWNDADAIQILRHTCAAAAPAGIVLVIEQIAPERVRPDPQQTLVIRGDIHMLAATGGMERTAAEYRALLARAGLELRRIVPTASSFSIIEAVPRTVES